MSSFTKRNIQRVFHATAVPVAAVATLITAVIRREPTGVVATVLLLAAYWAG